MRIILSVPGVLFWICGLINLKSLTEPYKKAFLIDVKTNTISMEGARSEPLRAWRYSWRFDELEKLYFTEERKGVPNSLKLKIKGRKKPINVEFLRVRGASNGGDMVNLYKEIITLVPSIKSVSDRMLQVYESSLAQWDKGNVPVSDIEVPDIDENGEKTSPSQQ
nr:hypothetical protein [Candidatus Sigynarchaeota archaeon]